MNAARPYLVPVTLGVLAALALAALVVLVRTSAGPGRLTAEIGATATPPGMAGPGFGPGLGDDAGPGFGPGLGDDAGPGAGAPPPGGGLGDDAGPGAGPGTGPGEGGGAGGPGDGGGLGDDAGPGAGAPGPGAVADEGEGGGGTEGEGGPGPGGAGPGAGEGAPGDGGLGDDAGPGPQPPPDDGDGGVHGPGGPGPGEAEGEGGEQPPAVIDPEPTPEPAPEPPPEPEKGCRNGVAVANPEANPGLVADCSVLLRARDTLRGTASLNWNSGVAIADWDGVGIGGSPPRVDGLGLRGRGLDGSVPAELGELSALRSLHLGVNRLTGRFPGEIGKLTNLHEIYAGGGNRFTGGFPPELANLTELRHLWFSSTRMGGPLPDLSGLSLLAILHLGGNGFTGPLPAWLGGLQKLRVLHLRGNDLTGCVPAALAGHDLSSLGLPDCATPAAAASACANGVTVPEPDSHPGLVADCEALLASKSALEGDAGAELDWGPSMLIAQWEGVEVAGTPPRVTGLALRQRGLAGAIPSALGRLDALGSLVLRGNRLTGSIPEAIGGIATLRTADFASNLLGGEIPASLGTAPSLTLADFAFNDGLTGCAPGGLRGKARHLPAEMTWCDTGNAVHAPPLARTTESEWRDALELEASGLAPGDCPARPVPASEGGPCVPARYTAACSKGVAVPDPQTNRGLVRDCALLLLARDPLRGTAPLNWSEDLPIAEWDGIGVNGDPPRVDGVHLRNRGLDGVVPHWLGGLTELVHLHFGARNYLTGPIPPELGNLSKLVQFYAGGRNALTGPIPAGFGDIRSLAALHLTGNRLTGVIPDLGGTNLSRLDLRGNELTGGIPEWLGGMTNLRVLSLRGNGLTGPIPRSIGRLPLLREVRLAQNELTGCVPSPLEDAAPAGWRNDVAELGLPWCLRYALDATGAVASAGSWAILDAGGGAGSGGGGVSGQAEAPPAVIATWEGLRSEAATLRVHQTDAGGTSWAAEFGAVSEGDLFEWRKASDCWVRYHVTGDPVRPAAGSGRWEFPVEWMTYAATGAGCTGAVGSAAVLGADEAAPDAVRSPDVVRMGAPVRHGPFLMMPAGWTGAIEPEVEVTATPPVFRTPEGSGASGSADQQGDGATPEWPAGYPHAAQLRSYQMRLDDTAPDWPTVYSRTMSPAEVRQHPLWREPVLPAGWYLYSAEVVLRGYEAYYANAQGFTVVRIRIWWLPTAPFSWNVIDHPTRIHELRIIDGHPATVQYGYLEFTNAPGGSYSSALVIIYDKSTGIEYEVTGADESLRKDIDATIAIASSLLPTADAP